MSRMRALQEALRPSKVEGAFRQGKAMSATLRPSDNKPLSPHLAAVCKACIVSREHVAKLIEQISKISVTKAR